MIKYEYRFFRFRCFETESYKLNCNKRCIFQIIFIRNLFEFDKIYVLT